MVVILYKITHSCCSSLCPPNTILSETISSSMRAFNLLKWLELTMRDKSSDRSGSFPQNLFRTFFKESSYQRFTCQGPEQSQLAMDLSILSRNQEALTVFFFTSFGANDLVVIMQSGEMQAWPLLQPHLPAAILLVATFQHHKLTSCQCYSIRLRI